MVNLTVFGAGKEVGRSGFEVKGANTKLLLDYGVLVKEERPSFPLSTSPKGLNGIIISHAQLDHSGIAPLFYTSESPPIYMANITKQLTDILIRDLLHLSSYYIPFEALELKTMIESSTDVREGKYKMGQAEVTFQPSGHIPGSMNALVSLEGKNLWYSGDINTIDTALLKRADPKLPELDMAIIESTYATVDHTPREECEKKLIDTANDVVEGRGVALIPAFSVGRSQEILCTLQKNRFKYDITIDGMSRTATKMIAGRPEELRDPKLLRDAMARSNWIQGQRDRDRALSKPGVIISSSGMLSGGASTRYMEKIKNRPSDAVILVSYQVPGTPGRILMDEGKYGPPGELKKARCRVEWVDFSSHSGKSGLMQIVKGLKGNPKVLCVHGEAASCTDFASRIKEETGLEAYAPSIGDSFTV